MKNLDKIKQLLKKSSTKRLFGENCVIEYENYFYKCPNYSGKYLFNAGEEAYKLVKENYEIIKKYFGKDLDIAKTEVFEDEELIYIVKQEKVYGEIVSRKLLKNPEIRKKILKLIEINKYLWKEKGLFLDILGSEAFFSPFKLHNLIMTGDQIFIFDFGFLKGKSNNSIFRFISKVNYYLQLFWIEKILLA